MRHDHLGSSARITEAPSPGTLSETLVAKATAAASRHSEAAGQRQEAGLDGWYNRSRRPRPWPFRPRPWRTRSPDSGAHGRIADGGGPQPGLETHKRWSAAGDSGRSDGL